MSAEPGTGRVDVRIVVAYIALGLCFVASFLPWARVLFITVNGTDGDGVLTLFLALAAALFLFLWQRNGYVKRGLLITAFVVTIVMAVVFIADTANVSRVANNSTSGDFDFSGAIDVGVGLYLGTIASIAAVVLQLLLLARSPAPTVAPNPAAPNPSFAATSPTASSAPVWDAQRGAWVSFDPARQAWLRYDDATQQWLPL